MTPYQEQLLNDCNAVLQLKNSYGWQIILRDAKANFDSISSNWFDFEDGSVELRTARSRQIANQIIMSLMDLYESKLQEVGTQVIHQESPDLIQTSDVDPGPEEPADE